MSTAAPCSRELLDPAGVTVRRAAVAFGAINIVSLVMLQGFGIPFAGSSVELCLPIYFASLALVVVGLKLAISPVRLVLYGAMVAAMVFSQLFSGAETDLAALALVLVLYSAFIFEIPVSGSTLRRVLGLFQRIMMGAAVLVFLQHAIQFTIGPGQWPSLWNLLPPEVLFPGYNYIQPFEYGSPFIKPNGLFFLEASFVSQFLAIALVIEIAIFRRLLVLTFFVAALFACLAGSGLLIFALAAPLLVLQAPPRLWLAGAVLLAVTGIAATALGWTEVTGRRIAEFSQPGSSAYNRYVRPMQQIEDLIERPKRVVIGHGAGRAPIGDQGDDTLPLSKMAYEYGFVATLILVALMISALFFGGTSLAIATVLFLFYNLGGGGLSVPVYVLVPAVLAANLKPRRDRSSADSEDGMSSSKTLLRNSRRQSLEEFRFVALRHAVERELLCQQPAPLRDFTAFFRIVHQIDHCLTDMLRAGSDDPAVALIAQPISAKTHVRRHGRNAEHHRFRQGEAKTLRDAGEKENRAFPQHGDLSGQIIVPCDDHVFTIRGIELSHYFICALLDARNDEPGGRMRRAQLAKRPRHIGGPLARLPGRQPKYLVAIALVR